MVTNILEHTKIAIGVSDNSFDDELLLLINSAVTSLIGLGVIEYNDVIVDETTEWPMIPKSHLGSVIQSYVVTKTRVIFEPSASATVVAAYDAFITRLEAHIQIITNEEVLV